jgi:hypothetical protein
MVEVDTDVKKRGGAGMALLKVGKAVATGGVSAGLDTATGGLSSGLGAIGRRIAGAFSKSPVGTDASQPTGLSAMERRYRAMP